MTAQDWDTRYAGDGLLWGSAANAAVIEQATSIPAGRALDLGCGEGRNALWLATRGWLVTAVDFSAVALEKGRRSAAPLPRSVRGRLDWVLADVTNIEFEADYDLVLAVHLNLCADERSRTLRRAAAALRPGGTLLTLSPTPNNDGGERELGCTATSLASNLGGAVTTTLAEPRYHNTESGPAAELLIVGIRPAIGS